MRDSEEGATKLYVMRLFERVMSIHTGNSLGIPYFQERSWRWRGEMRGGGEDEVVEISSGDEQGEAPTTAVHERTAIVTAPATAVHEQTAIVTAPTTAVHEQAAIVTARDQEGQGAKRMRVEKQYTLAFFVKPRNELEEHEKEPVLAKMTGKKQ